MRGVEGHIACASFARHRSRRFGTDGSRCRPLSTECAGEPASSCSWDTVADLNENVRSTAEKMGYPQAALRLFSGHQTSLNGDHATIGGQRAVTSDHRAYLRQLTFRANWLYSSTKFPRSSMPSASPNASGSLLEVVQVPLLCSFGSLRSGTGRTGRVADEEGVGTECLVMT